MIADILPNAYAVEIAQLLVALFGTGLAFWKVWIAFANGLLITKDGSMDLRRLVAETQVIAELFRLFKQGCLVALGVISVLLPPPDPFAATPQPELLQNFLIRCGLITLTIAMAADSTIQEVRRRQFLDQVDARADQK